MKIYFNESRIQFFDRNTRLNILFDEVIVLAERISSPEYVSLVFINFSNLKCRHSCALVPKEAKQLTEFEKLKRFEKKSWNAVYKIWTTLI